MAPACEIVGEDHITRPKTARGAIADPDYHLPRENKNVLPPGRGVPIAEIVRRETAEHEIGARLKRNVMALLSARRTPCSAAIISAAFSPIMIVGAFVFRASEGRLETLSIQRGGAGR